MRILSIDRLGVITSLSQLLLFILTLAAFIGIVPSIFGFLTLGILTGTAIAGNVLNQSTQDSGDTLDAYDDSSSDSVTIDECYPCSSYIDTDSSVYGELTLYNTRTQSEKDVPLCESCTWTYTTLADNHDHLVKVYGERGDTEEI